MFIVVFQNHGKAKIVFGFIKADPGVLHTFSVEQL